MIPIDFARRKARGGKGVIPPNTTQWNNEHNALDVRESLHLEESAALPEIVGVYGRLLPTVEVMAHGSLPVAAMFADHFRTSGRGSWSGLAITMDDGSIWVAYNDAHAVTRVRATLMEEFFHIYLEHPRSTVRLLPDHENTGRTFDQEVEREAYGCAAACLVPY